MGVATPSETNPAPEMVSEGASLEELARAAETCQACELYREATQVVFGVGPKSAPLMLIGEQPGDAEDQEGEPFVGPAGSVLAAARQEAGIRSEDVYLTNVVKHFRWKPKGKRRLHQAPPSPKIVSDCEPPWSRSWSRPTDWSARSLGDKREAQSPSADWASLEADT
jgi:uracil-DNA glycosylase